ncbi:hypothetical protein L226DRAFT_473218 [Lentinus tigrinus ALCF2SS1-7]|nr:hypothetical protein L226DRAFT_473218 [Lentinus tigrinus ALCF2SS1-7]
MPRLKDLGVYPRWDWDGSTLLRYFRQILEGIEGMHRVNIAHMDIAKFNILCTWNKDHIHHPHLQPDTIYFIDFGSSRQFDAGPGRQPAVELGPAQYKPPLEMQAFDPFSWDIMCAGMLLRDLAKAIDFPGILQPLLFRRYVDWLIGRERGCLTVCRCRPSARRAIRVLAILQWAFRVECLCRRALTFLLPRITFGSKSVRSD